MAFTLRTADGNDERFGDEARYWFDEHGHLVVSESNGQRRTFATGTWTYIDEQRDADAAKNSEGVV